MTLEQRIVCYQFFSEFFRGTFDPKINEYWDQVHEWLGIEPVSGDFDQDLQKAWAKTFFGVGNETVTLTHSSWTNALRLQCQAPSLSAHNAYVKAGVSPDVGEDALPDDHVSLLTGFMAWLLTNDQPSQAFFEEHFGAWMHTMNLAVQDRLGHTLGCAVWQAFDRFIQSETEIYRQEKSSMSID